MTDLLNILSSTLTGYVVTNINFEHFFSSTIEKVFICNIELATFIPPVQTVTGTRIYFKKFSEFDILMSFLEKINSNVFRGIGLVGISTLEDIVKYNFGDKKLEIFLESDTYSRILASKIKEELVNG